MAWLLISNVFSLCQNMMSPTASLVSQELRDVMATLFLKTRTHYGKCASIFQHQREQNKAFVPGRSPLPYQAITLNKILPEMPNRDCCSFNVSKLRVYGIKSYREKKNPQKNHVMFFVLDELHCTVTM